MHSIRHMRKTPYESPAAPMSNNATDPVELNVFAHQIKTAEPNSVRFGTWVERRLNRAWDAHADALHIINRLSPERDQHQISPCNINCFVIQSGHDN